MADESKLYAETKQVNQFFRRFNGEEDEKGERYYPKDRQYRSPELRQKYLGILFDASNAGIPRDRKIEFARDVISDNDPVFLDFHNKEWFAEVTTLFTLNNQLKEFKLFMALEKDGLGYKWVITRVWSEMFENYMERDTTGIGKFLHPMSHELDFMNLRKAMIDRDSVSQFVKKEYQPDYLTLFLYEIKKGNLTFKTVKEVKFHFFQVKDWYFQISEFNRTGYNTGWLISDLVKVEDRDKDIMRKYIYHEK
ncbi:hypothetical protein [Fulvivirga sedimenti]|uniref:Uncharacterized protein n=1 Tax=Fulvivirga sedimenti TaxID=2879465 RepID=A0A9X1HRL2_9BACT|nr:hypothetical protein [Fulvivirga sedimenti]MCA6075492.1 hypothetical protein [Fulvivirga sedimenti]MCA6076669.1 hypothetical protein [Fulvivirga sedimenti]MCA6077797.1 hypothetical protein [Fulvivirga sedimenti]